MVFEMVIKTAGLHALSKVMGMHLPEVFLIVDRIGRIVMFLLEQLQVNTSSDLLLFASFTPLFEWHVCYVGVIAIRNEMRPCSKPCYKNVFVRMNMLEPGRTAAIKLCHQCCQFFNRLSEYIRIND